MNKASRPSRRSGRSTLNLSRTSDEGSPLSNRLPSVLNRLTKAQLISLLSDIVERWPQVGQHLMIELDTQQPTGNLVDDIKESLRQATYVPKHEINRNFSFDYGAYGRVRKGLTKLVDRGQLQEAMDLAIEVMCQGSYQVEMSDEGMMSDEVVDCVRAVYDAVQAAEMDEGVRAKWLSQLIAADNVGFLAEAVQQPGKYFWR